MTQINMNRLGVMHTVFCCKLFCFFHPFYDIGHIECLSANRLTLLPK